MARQIENEKDAEFYHSLAQVLNIHWHFMELLIENGDLQFPEQINYNLRNPRIGIRQKTGILAGHMATTLDQALHKLFKPQGVGEQPRKLAEGEYVLKLLTEAQNLGAIANPDMYFILERRIHEAIIGVGATIGKALAIAYETPGIPFDLQRHLGLVSQIRPTDLKEQIVDRLGHSEINDTESTSRLDEKSLERFGLRKRLGCPSFKFPNAETVAYLVQNGIPEEELELPPGMHLSRRVIATAKEYIGPLPK